LEKITYTIALFVGYFQLETTFERLGTKTQIIHDVKEQNLFIVDELLGVIDLLDKNIFDQR